MDSSNSSLFYKNLPLLESFFEISDSSNFHPFPEDWYVAVTDIKNSTTAIEEGRYKFVNILGVSPIVGILNKQNRDQVPYIFGGDGCIICIPPALLERTRDVLSSCRKIGKQGYNLNLRAAVIPVRRIREAGNDVLVARYRVSSVYNQAIFAGNGISYAEKLLKSENNFDESYQIPIANNADGTDFSGLECRWQEVGRKGKSVITILVRSNPLRDDADAIYENVLQKLREFFGFDDVTNPIDSSQLDMEMSLSSLMGEIKFQTFGMNWYQRIKYFLKMETEIILGKIFMALGYKFSETDWSLYKPDLVLNSDHRKFDDMLRLVISGTPEQMEKMTTFLEEQQQLGRLAYGLHVTDTAVITCMIFKYQRQHVHFVDGSDGGYVKASRQLKENMARLTS